MYTGHFGIALAGKGVAPRVPLWICIAAAFAPDLIISLSQLLFGMQQQVIEPMAASLTGGFGTALILGLIYLWSTGEAKEATVVGALSLLHVLADFITGRAVVWLGGPEMGLQLYSYDYADFILETSLVIAGWLLYHRTLPKHKQRTWSAWMILAFLIGLQLYFTVRPFFLGD